MCHWCDECHKVQNLTKRGVGEAAAGLGVHFLHMSEGPFSHDAGQLELTSRRACVQPRTKLGPRCPLGNIEPGAPRELYHPKMQSRDGASNYYIVATDFTEEMYHQSIDIGFIDIWLRHFMESIQYKKCKAENKRKEKLKKEHHSQQTPTSLW